MEEQEKLLNQPAPKLSLPAGKKRVSTLIGILIIVLVAVIAFGGVFAYQYLTKPLLLCWPYCPNMTDADREQIKSDALTAAGWKTYTNTQSGFEFKYPSIISVAQEGANVALNHSISYTHFNPCDLKGDAPPLDKLTDFSVSVTISNKNLEDTKKDNFVWTYNPFNVGSLNGFNGESGIEGCGVYTYLFPISENRILVVRRSYIAEFNPITADYQKYLALPGIINPTQEEEYFNQIFSTFKVTTPVNKVVSCKKPILSDSFDEIRNDASCFINNMKTAFKSDLDVTKVLSGSCGVIDIRNFFVDNKYNQAMNSPCSDCHFQGVEVWFKCTGYNSQLGCFFNINQDKSFGQIFCPLGV